MESEILSKIKQASKKEFEQKGLKKANLNQIAKSCGKSKSILYYYFDSKEALFLELLRDEFSQITSYLAEKAASQEDAALAIENYLKLRLLLFANFSLYHQVLKADFEKPYVFAQEEREKFTQFEQKLLQDLLAKGIEEGNFYFENTQNTSKMIQMIFFSLETQFFVQEKFMEYGFLMEELLGVLLQALKKKK
ncbi:MAG: hypothetical protein C4K58_03995 [Flavobacteriaceae bacterium]|nr:MAG: hypothetical protein C4K58_03995 [Flavobacteriaceae bacterium]